MSETNKKPVVTDPAVAAAFSALGITVDNASGGANPDNSEQINILKAEIDTLKKAITDKDAIIATHEANSSDPGQSPELMKAIDTLSKKLDSIGVIEKSVYESVQSVNEVVDTLTKSVEDSIEQLTDIDERLERLETTPATRKSVHSGNIRTLEKAFQVDEASGNKVLSKFQHRTELVNLLDSLAGDPASGSVNEMYADACVRYETSGQLTKAVIDDLNSTQKITVID